MAFPVFYDPNRVGQYFSPRIDDVNSAAKSVRNVSFAADDRTKTLLLLVDMQVDFVFEKGALSVPGAVADTVRVIEWIYRNVGKITQIAASLDSHVPTQIFFPSWWEDQKGNHPAPYTVITSDDVSKGKWQAIYEPKWSATYVSTLESQSKKNLMIWPYHTLLGTPGHNLVPSLYEALAYHGELRGTQPYLLTKGTLLGSEYYSIVEPEVKVPNDPNGGVNVNFLDFLGAYDAIYIAGQAKSHCVLETITSVMRYFSGQPDVIGKLRFVMDGMSSVAHPTIDFDGMANVQLEAYRQQGAQFVYTTTDLK